MIAQCVQCGYCCTVRPCSYGKWNEKEHRCLYLTENNHCSIYEKVKHDQFNPAMSAGCCASLFNTVREKKINASKTAKML